MSRLSKEEAEAKRKAEEKKNERKRMIEERRQKAEEERKKEEERKREEEERQRAQKERKRQAEEQAAERKRQDDQQRKERQSTERAAPTPKSSRKSRASSFDDGGSSGSWDDESNLPGFEDSDEEEAKPTGRDVKPRQCRFILLVSLFPLTFYVDDSAEKGEGEITKLPRSSGGGGDGEEECSLRSGTEGGCSQARSWAG